MTFCLHDTVQKRESDAYDRLIAPRKVGAPEEIRAASGTIVTRKEKGKELYPVLFPQKREGTLKEDCERIKERPQRKDPKVPVKGTSSSVESKKPVCHHEKKEQCYK